jgi:PTH1 family peptidyl-tRNA hydrolase
VKLIVGLGNPGYEYHLTPHNLGFMALDRLAEKWGVEVSRPEAQALTAVTRVGNEDLVLAKPQTYMNLSGLSVSRLLKSIIGSLQSDEFTRVRIGVQPDHAVRDRAPYVLGRFRKADLETVAQMLDTAADAVELILREGSERAMNRYNRRVSSPES